MRNWISNSSEVLEALGQTTPKVPKNLNIDPEAIYTKVLGMWWCPTQDSFTFSTKAGNISKALEIVAGKPTKRQVLRTLMTIFDPLGFLAAFLVYLKILLQDIWRSNIDWDDEINDEHYDRWVKWLKVLPEVQNIKIPRCYISNRSADGASTTIQLHVFVDASENAFAAVAYLIYGIHQ